MYNKDSDSLDTGAPDITITGNQRMASQPDPTAEMNDFSMKVFGKPLHQLTPPQLEQLYELMNEQAKAPQQNQRMASAVLDESDEISMGLFGKPVKELTPP